MTYTRKTVVMNNFHSDVLRGGKGRGKNMAEVRAD